MQPGVLLAGVWGVQLGRAVHDNLLLQFWFEPFLDVPSLPPAGVMAMPQLHRYVGGFGVWPYAAAVAVCTHFLTLY